VINGITYASEDSLALNMVLRAHPTKRVIELMKIAQDSKIVSPTTNEIVVIAFAHQQPKKKIRKTLRQLKSWLWDEYSVSIGDIPRLMVDNHQIEPSETKQQIDNLKVKDILYIHIQKVAPDAGQRNGEITHDYVKIWTKHI
jgi:hypothetical protein